MGFTMRCRRCGHFHDIGVLGEPLVLPWICMATFLSLLITLPIALWDMRVSGSEEPRWRVLVPSVLLILGMIFLPNVIGWLFARRKPCDRCGIPLRRRSRRDHPMIRLSGRVVDPAGNPVRQATVHFFRDRKGDEDSATLVLNCDSNEEGRFTIDKLAAGEWLLVVTHVGHAPSPGVRCAGGEQLVELQVRPNLRFSGIVQDEKGVPVPGAWIYVRGPGLLNSAAGDSDEGGRFSVGPVAGETAIVSAYVGELCFRDQKLPLAEPAVIVLRKVGHASG
jgi:hypothetical protein